MRFASFIAAVALAIPATLPSQNARLADSVTVRIVNTELRSAVQIIQQYLDKPVIFSGPANGPQVSLETPRSVPRSEIPRLLRGLLDSQGYELVDDTASGMYRARQKEVPRPVAQAGVPYAPPGSAMTPQRQVSAPELFVIALRHARAADVAATINALFGRSAPQGAFGQSMRAPTLSDELRSTQIPPVDAPLPQTIPGTVGRAATMSGELTIVADARANSLRVRSNRADFELIQA